MTVRETSLEAYSAIKSDGTLTRQQQHIIDKMRTAFRRDITRSELSQLTGYPINVIAGRVNELVKLGALVEVHKRTCTVTGRNVMALAIPVRQGDLFEAA